MNAHLNLSLASEPFHIQPQLSKELQQQLNETRHISNSERSFAQLMNLDYKSNSVISGPLASNNMNDANNLLKAAELLPSSFASQKDFSSLNSNSLLSAMAPGVRSDMLNRLLFPTPLSSTTTETKMGLAATNNAVAEASTIDLCQQALNEIKSTNNLQPTQDTGFAAFEPSPINENNMTVLQQGINDANAFQLWRHQQQQQMQNLLHMAFQSSTTNGGLGGLQRSSAADLSSLMASSNTANEAAKRTLNPSSLVSASPMDSELFNPAKKQRGMPSGTTNDALRNSSVAMIDEDCLNKSGRFRDYQSCQWSVRFHELQLFRRLKGHCCVPHGYPENPVLARWVKRQRYQYKLRAEGKPSTMTIERINALERIGFVWDSHGAGWMERYNELQEYAKKYGSCNVSSSYISFHGSQLSSWVKCQRRQYKMFKEGSATNMTADRIAKLERIGFEWELRRPRTSNNSGSKKIDEKKTEEKKEDDADANNKVKPTLPI